MFKFIHEKSTAFPNATISQKDFWSIPPFKRAMVWVFFLRFLLGQTGQKQWKNFSLADYKQNIRTFCRWMNKDREIMENCSSFISLPHTKPVSISRIGKKGAKRRRGGASTSESSPPHKRSISISLVSTDEDEDEEWSNYLRTNVLIVLRSEVHFTKSPLVGIYAHNQIQELFIFVYVETFI